MGLTICLQRLALRPLFALMAQPLCVAGLMFANHLEADVESTTNAVMNLGDLMSIAMAKRRKFLHFSIWGICTIAILAVMFILAILTGRANEQGSRMVGLVVCCGFYLSLSALIIWFYFCFYSVLCKPFYQYLIFLALFVWGCVAYFQSPVDLPDEQDQLVQMTMVERGTEAINRTIAAFFPSRGGFEVLSGSANRMHYFAFQSATLLFVTGLMFAIFGRSLVNKFRVRTTLQKHLNVFWGIDQQGLLLGESVISETVVQQVVFLLPNSMRNDKDEIGRITHRLDEMGCLWELMDFDRIPGNALYGNRHFFLHESGHENIRQANRLVQVMGEHYQGERKTFYIRIESSADRQIYCDWCEYVRRKNDKVEPVIINEAEMTSSDFLEKYTRLQHPDTRISLKGGLLTDFKVLLVGFGKTGQEVFNGIICNAQLLKDGSKTDTGLSVDVVERDETVVDRYLRSHPQVESEINVNFENRFDATACEFEDWLDGHVRQYQQIVLCLPDDELNIRLAELAQKILRKHSGGNPQILLKVLDKDRCDYWKHKDDVFVGTFGTLRNLYSWKLLNIDQIDKIARALNAKWSDPKCDMSPERIEGSWRGASYSNRQSSRASARCEHNLLRLLGYEVTDDRNASSVDVGKIAEVIEDRIDILGRNEHLRWNAYHVLAGYSRWDMRDIDDLPIKDRKAKQLDRIGKHAAIVPYDELPKVDYRIAKSINGDAHMTPDFERLTDDSEYELWNGSADAPTKTEMCLQGKDRVFCRQIPENMKTVGLKIVPKGT